MEYILGIDQGTSHTRAAVADINGNIIGLYRCGGANHSITGINLTMQMIYEASIGALKIAGIENKHVSVLFSGMTGADFEDEYEMLHNEILKLNLCQNVVVKNDCIIALRGGTLKPFGAIVSVGSGVNCAVISPNGQEFIYQYYVEDYIQGGSALSRRILDAIYQAETYRIGKTQITELVLKKLNFQHVDELLRADVEKKISVKRRLEIVPLLFDAAFQGDETSATIIQEIAKAFAGLVIGGINRFNLHDIEFEVVISGSVFKGKGALLIDTFSAEIQSFAPKAKIINAIYEPVVGAILLGIENLANRIDESILRNIEKSSEKFALKREITN